MLRRLLSARSSHCLQASHDELDCQIGAAGARVDRERPVRRRIETQIRHLVPGRKHVAFDIGLPFHHPPAVLVWVVAGKMHGQECHPAILGDFLPGIARDLRRIDAVSDHAMTKSQVVRGNAIRDDVAFGATRGRKATAQEGLLDRVDPHMDRGQAKGQKASNRGLVGAGQA